MNKGNQTFGWMLGTLAGLSVTLTGVPRLQAEPMSAETLYERAAQHFIQDESLYPVKIIEHETTRNKKGKLEQEIKTHLRLSRDGDDYSFTVKSCHIDGKRIPDEHLRHVEEELNASTDETLEMEVEYLFAAAQATRISLDDRVEEAQLGARACAVLSFTLALDHNTWIGRAWIDRASGVPIKVQATPQVFPHVKKKVTIKAMEVTVHYDKVTGAKIGPVKTENAATIHVKVMPLITFKGRTLTVTTYSNYQR